MTVVTVRPATLGDLNDVASLVAAFRSWLGRTTPTDQQIREQIAQRIGTPTHDFLLAQREEGPGDEERRAAVGVAVLTFRTSIWAAGRGVCHLEECFVTAEVRGGGVGRALVQAAADRAHQWGCYRIDVDVNAGNPSACGLYESCGFSATDDTFDGKENLFLHRLL